MSPLVLLLVMPLGEKKLFPNLILCMILNVPVSAVSWDGRVEWRLEGMGMEQSRPPLLYPIPPPRLGSFTQGCLDFSGKVHVADVWVAPLGRMAYYSRVRRNYSLVLRRPSAYSELHWMQQRSSHFNVLAGLGRGLPFALCLSIPYVQDGTTLLPTKKKSQSGLIKTEQLRKCWNASEEWILHTKVNDKGQLFQNKDSIETISILPALSV